MKIEKITLNGYPMAAVSSEQKLLTDSQSALELISTAKYEAGTKNIVLSKELIAEEFFILSTGLAGEILQKFINYGARLAVYGDYSKYTSKPLKDFIYESNKGKDIFFAASKEEACQMLGGIKTEVYLCRAAKNA